MFDVRPVDTDYVRHRAAQFRAQVVRKRGMRGQRGEQGRDNGYP